MKVPELFKGDENFWILNPEYKSLFDDLYKKDKSPLKNKSSKIMWAFYFKLNPESVYYNLPNKEELINSKIIKDEDFSWKKYENEEILFKNTILTQAERSLYEWNELMKKRDKYLKNTDYYFDEYKTDDDGNNVYSKTGLPIIVRGTAEQLDKAFSVTPKMYSDYNKILKELTEEKDKRGRGNKPISSSDANRI